MKFNNECNSLKILKMNLWKKKKGKGNISS